VQKKLLTVNKDDKMNKTQEQKRTSVSAGLWARRQVLSWISQTGTYCKDSVCTLTQRAVIGRVDGSLMSKPRVKLTHVRLITLQ